MHLVVPLILTTKNVSDNQSMEKKEILQNVPNDNNIDGLCQSYAQITN